jgi:anti-sigma factor ChrR (cupin superfamily)
MAATGDFTIRLKMPDGYKVAPHTHPNRENVTVLSGTLKVGMGDQFVSCNHLLPFATRCSISE